MTRATTSLSLLNATSAGRPERSTRVPSRLTGPTEGGCAALLISRAEAHGCERAVPFLKASNCSRYCEGGDERKPLSQAA